MRTALLFCLGVAFALAQNPLARPDPFEGMFEGDGITLTMTVSGGDYAGTLTFQGQKYPATMKVMDVQMPEVDGLQAASMIRREELRRGPGRTAILALTAHTARQQHEQCMAAGMDGVITKPVNRATLLQAIADTLKAQNKPQSGLFAQETT